MIVWRRDRNGDFQYHFIVDMGHHDWRHTWAAQYSPLDTKLMVAGVVNEMRGEIAIFSTGICIIVCKIGNNKRIDFNTSGMIINAKIYFR